MKKRFHAAMASALGTLDRMLESDQAAAQSLWQVCESGRLDVLCLPTSDLMALLARRLVQVLIQEPRGRTPRTWVYPSEHGLAVYALMARVMDRSDAA